MELALQSRVSVPQGEASSLPIFGVDYSVINMESTQCEGYFRRDLSSNDHLSYIVVIEGQ
jgi:hypothetical protein